MLSKERQKTATGPGNTVNGLGEEAMRPPRMVWWTPDMDKAKFGTAQKWFYEHEEPDAEMLALRKRRYAAIAEPLPELADTALEQSPEERTASLAQFVKAGDVEMTGVARLRPEWLFDDAETEFQTVIMLGVQHQYGRAAEASKKLAGWLRTQGWDADPITGPMTGKILMIPPALECGFGELGKHGSLINPEFGSAFRLGAVLSNAPFALTEKRAFRVDEFCLNCRICEDACPPFAISPEKQTVRGVEKWYVDFDKCIPFFAETSGCAICIAVCPWSRPGVGFSLAEKLERRAERRAEET